ncbi:phage tail protein [Chitinimonas sp. PSY-7]|uniref:phage tail protein n=1 Tax=Chitinimonas sp. PSY-7 TaxID=3459088 RepID=UPI00404025EA
MSMYKAQSLREHLTQSNPALAKNPDKLLVFVDEGRLRTNWGKSLSFEYQYTLRVFVLDFADSLDALFVPLLLWLRQHQSDLIQNAERQADGIRFEVEPLNHEASDIEIKLKLTEKVKVSERDGGLEAEHLGENIPKGNLWVQWLPGLELGERLVPAWPS